MDNLNRQFGRVPSPPDNRDFKLSHFMPRGALKQTFITSKKWDFPVESLDQEISNHCCGFAMADFGINLPTFTKYTNDDGHKFYYLCKIEDGEPGMEDGSYIRSVVKVLKNLGKIEAYAFAYDMESIKWWILNRGPMIVGTAWTEGMMIPDEENIIHVIGRTVGGHAYLLNEWREDGYIGIQNSWGTSWGDNGKAYIGSEDFKKIFMYDGEAVTAVEIVKENFFKRFFKWMNVVCKQ